MHINVQPAQADTAPEALADLLWNTDPALNSFMFRTREVLHLVLACEWPENRGLLCHKHALTVMEGQTVLGLLIGHTAKEYGANFEAAVELQTGKLPQDDKQHMYEALYWMDRLFPTPQDDTFYILELSTAVAAQGLGVASALLGAATERATAQGCRSISLDVAADNAAVDFYRRLGFEVVIETKVPWLAKTAGIGLHYHMVKNLT